MSADDLSPLVNDRAKGLEAGRRPLQWTRWADVGADGLLRVSTDERPIAMANSDGTGETLVGSGRFGADLIRFKAGEGVQNHVHEGDHILFCIAGEGTVSFWDEPYGLSPGICYFVPGDAPHAIKASSDLVLIAVANQHFPVGSPGRMTPVAGQTLE